ncbi:MAG: hypothetical protein IJP47_05820 [Prevotella sp.]|nr:hypothetical protein [Prevotella sp.]
MKKRLLSLAAAALTTLSGFALTQGDYVYTPQGRFKVIDAASQVQFDLQNFTGFTAFSATEGRTAADIFTTGTDGDLNYFQALATTGSAEGMNYQLSLAVGKKYVVSYKMKSSTLTSTHATICNHVVGGAAADLGMNKAVVYNTRPDTVYVKDGEGNPTTEIESINYVDNEFFSQPQTISTDWTTFAYAITNVNAKNKYYISFSGMSSDVLIADLEVHEVTQVADMRIRDKYKSLAEAYINLHYLNDDAKANCGLVENYEEMMKLDDDASQTALEMWTAGIDATLYEEGGLCQESMDNWLGTNNNDILGPNTPFTKVQKQTDHGIWQFMENGGRSGRFFSEKADTYFEGPHGGGNYGLKNTVALETREAQGFLQGSYVFTVDMNGIVREKATSSCWDINFGLEAFYGRIYLLNAAGDTVKASEPVLLPTGTNEADANYERLVLSWEVDEPRAFYTLGMEARPRDGVATNLGNTITFKDATLYYYTVSPYTKKQHDYIADVREQVATGRTELTTSDGYLNSADYSWGKAELQACVDTVAPKIVGYEAVMDTLSIIGTYADTYVKSTSEATGLLVYEVYQEAVKDILAANRTFIAQNDSLGLLVNAIADSKDLLSNRIFDASTERTQLENAVANAELILNDLKTKDYSDENVATVKAQIAALAEANNIFQENIPAESVTGVVDIDFSAAAVTSDTENDYTTLGGPATITGQSGTMEFTNFMTTNPLAAPSGNKNAQYFPYQKGIDVDGAPINTDVLRVGQGTGLVNFDLGEIGTNIVKVSMDWYLGRLSGCFVGFRLKDENSEDVSGLYFSPYDANNYSYNPVNVNNLVFAANTAGDAGFITDDNKTSMQLYLDYGTKKAQLATQVGSKTYTSDWVEFNGNDVKTFVLESNYNYAQGRRCWFDNLKIEVIKAGDPTAVSEVKAADAQAKAAAKKVVNGQLVIETAKGTFNAAGAQVK